MTQPIGEAISVSQNGDLVRVTNAQGKTAFRRVSGIEEVQQAIRLRLKTRLGEDIITPTMGLPVPSMIANPTEDFISARIRRALADELRIESVDSIEIELDRQERVADISISATLKGGRTLTIQEAFEV